MSEYSVLGGDSYDAKYGKKTESAIGCAKGDSQTTPPCLIY
jgi:hypothetical protein